MTDEKPDGVWIAYQTDIHLYDVRPFADELSALRHANQLGYYMSVLFVPFGESVEDTEKAQRSGAAS